MSEVAIMLTPKSRDSCVQWKFRVIEGLPELPITKMGNDNDNDDGFVNQHNHFG